MSTRTIPTEENGRVTLADVVNRDKRFRYMLLSRLQSDCDYYLHYGGGCPKTRWNSKQAN